MITRILSDRALIKAFRLRDRKHVELPKKFIFPFEFEYYLTWSEPSGAHRYLVFPHENQLCGIVFKRNHHQKDTQTGRLCDWCHAYGPADQIDLLTIALNSRTTIGVILCLDLSCLQKIEYTIKNSKKTFDQHALELVNRMTHFYRENFERRISPDNTIDL